MHKYDWRGTHRELGTRCVPDGVRIGTLTGPRTGRPPAAGGADLERGHLEGFEDFLVRRDCDLGPLVFRQRLLDSLQRLFGHVVHPVHLSLVVTADFDTERSGPAQAFPEAPYPHRKLLPRELLR
jgi:hypothetical protein